MRIQARLFVGTAVLVLALMGGQWWLHVRQVRAVEHQLEVVAASVGKGLLTVGPVQRVLEERLATMGADGATKQPPGMVWFEELHQPGQGEGTSDGDETTPPADGSGATLPSVRVIVVPAHAAVKLKRGEHRVVPTEPEEGASGARPNVSTTATLALTMSTGDECATDKQLEERVQQVLASLPPDVPRRIELMVEQDASDEDRMLVLKADTGVVSTVPIPVAPAVKLVNQNLRQGIALSGALLAVGLVASGVMARRVARPLQDLAARAEALGEGELGAQVEEDAGGEVGELQRAFNRMSSRLAELEIERQRWRQREHLAQLGEVARGLAHTLRNPMNTLGLVVEEISGDDAERQELAAVARAQIHRIDRWLRSFLAIGAGDAARLERRNLAEMVQAAVLESVQRGVRVTLRVEDDTVHAELVETAMRAALSNLLDNAGDASPEGAAVEVSVGRDRGDAVIRIVDRGPGLPDEVRARLFSPHVTTKPEGSGMGLYLSRQIVVEMHGGRLDLRPADGGGTEAVLRLPLSGDDTEAPV